MFAGKAKRRYRRGSVVIAAVVALHEPIVTSGRNVFLVQATISPAICCPLVTVQMFEVQLDQVRVVEIGRKVVTGVRWMSAHADDSTPNLGRQPLDMFRIPGLVVSNLTPASKCAWLIKKQKQDNPGRDRRKPLVKGQHASTHSFMSRRLTRCIRKAKTIRNTNDR